MRRLGQSLSLAIAQTQSSLGLAIPIDPTSLYLHSIPSLRGKFIHQPLHSLMSLKNESDIHGVVSIRSPVNTAFAPARKHIACSASVNSCRPAARRITVVGSAMRAVAMVRSMVL